MTQDIKDLQNSFIFDYNAKIDELNDEHQGIFDADEDAIDMKEEHISNWFDADKSIVIQDEILILLYNELCQSSYAACKPIIS